MKFGQAQKAKLGLNASDTAVLTLTFHFLSSPLFLLIFLPRFFSFVGHLVGKILGKLFGGSGTRFSRNFQVNVTWFFAFFSHVLD